jgi:glycosyltransferase involved in cell wall biosynthesis
MAGTLWVCVNVYNDRPSVGRTLTSIRRAAPHGHIVVVDGAYRDFPHPAGHPESQDGTLAVAGEFADRIVRVKDGEPWADECVKRSAYLIGSEGDYYLVVDADEELVGEVPRRMYVPAVDVVIESAANPPTHVPYPIFRMFAHRGSPGAMRYAGAHMAIWSGDRLLNERVRQVAGGFRLRHWNHERDARRLIDKGTYYERMCRAEEPFRSSRSLV